jgi:hypothetical protein
VTTHRSDVSPVARALPWLLCATGLLFDLVAFYPGQMSFDSAYTWWQARVGETSDTQSVMLIHLWRVLDSILPGPGPVFVLQLVLFWGGLLMIAIGLRLRPFAATLMVMLAGFAPAIAVLRGHVWTDVGLAGALLVATGALALFARTRGRGWLALVVASSLCALALRHNALPALLPLAVYVMHRLLAREDSGSARARVAIASVLALGVLYGIIQAVNATADRHLPTWRALAAYDLAALSIATGKLLFPPELVGPGMDVADLAQAYAPWSVVAVLSRTRNGIRNPLEPGWTPAEAAALRDAWLDACLAHPREYIAHRLRFSAALFGTHPPDWPDTVKFVPESFQVRDNPPVARNATALHRWIIGTARRLRATPVFAAWPYLVVGIFALPFAWRRRERSAARIALVLIASGTLYALPLMVFAPSAELRYVFWPCVASLVAGVLAFARDEGTSAERNGAGVPNRREALHAQAAMD